MKNSGILLHISSLPSSYGIGDFGKEAYKFADFLKASKQKYWQILPLNPPGEDNSPYQAFSAFAGNPYFIDLDALYEQGLISDRYKSLIWKKGNIDYELLYKNKDSVLREISNNLDKIDQSDFDRFCQDNHFWLEDYAIFMALYEYFNKISWNEWEPDIVSKNPETISIYQEKLKTEIAYWKTIQYLFWTQWFKLKNYANSLGIEIIGDLPIYISYHSADVWAYSQNFMLDSEKKPSCVAGVPPDIYSSKGQLWGNPVYDWEYMKQEGFSWWLNRLMFSQKCYDHIRIDHFIGFANYYSIPAGAQDAITGQWKKAYGKELFEKFKQLVPNAKILAEDLGNKTQEVEKLLDYTGYPGMVILQNWYDSLDVYKFLDSLKQSNIVVYTGTHDNNTIKGWYKSISSSEKRAFKKITGCKFDVVKAMISLGVKSNADKFIVPIQDYLGLGEKDRMNIPATKGNWIWRLKNDNYIKKYKKIIRLTTKQ